MKTTVKQLIISSLLAISPFTNLDAQLKISAEVRPRAEYRHGYKSLVKDNDEEAFQISQRTRLNFNYNSEKVKYQISLQDVRLWGDVSQLTTASTQLMLQQGWAEYLFTNILSLKIGRQELNYDDSRILGNVDWTQQARSHDIALLKYEKNFKLHFGLAFNQGADKLINTNYEVVNNYKTMQFLWFNKKINDLNVSLLFLNNGMQNKSADVIPVFKTVYSQTIGSKLGYNMESVSVFGAGYYTFGKDVTMRKLSAYYASAGANITLNTNLSAELGWELLSGTSQLEKAKNADYTNKSFNPFYGTNHKFNGHMDYFFVGNHLNSVGLNDLNANLSYKKGKFNATLTPHYFWAANDIINPDVVGGSMPNYLGTEIDFTIGYRLADNVQLSGGYSQMFGSKLLNILNPTGDINASNNWAWMMLSFKPDFLK